jgi:N-acyl-D-aspartate/D-glutamate deacylase
LAGSHDYDCIIRGGFVVDGTGLPRRRIDVGIRDGKIARLAPLDGASAGTEIDAAGAIVAPGIVDIHTHYDPQITFDPYATMSCYHGVTTVVAGNCGFSVAPCRHEDVPFLKDIFASVEDMDPAALGGVRWDKFETFAEFLDSLNGALGINFACYIGHSNIRRWVMGEDCYTRSATAEEIAQMVELVGEAMRAGAAGFSSSASPTQVDIHNRPVPSRLAAEDELIALVAEVGRWKSASISYLPHSVQQGLDEADRALLVRIALAAGVPIVIQGLGGRSKVDAPTESWESAEAFLSDANARGAAVFSLTMARPFDRAASLGPENKHFRGVPSWHAMLQAPIEERRAMLRDPAVRERMRYAVENPNTDPAAGTTVKPPTWDALVVEKVALDRNKPLEGRTIAAIAEEHGKAPGDVVLDLALDEDFASMLRWTTESPAWRTAVRTALVNPHIIAGTSDGGAHLAKDDGADWSTQFLRKWVLDDPIWTLEEGIRQLTQVPAALMGLHDRGTLRVGGPADIMIFDETVAPTRKEFTRDLPGDAGRWRAWGKGVRATIVNGEPIVLDGELTGRLPGQVVSPD